MSKSATQKILEAVGILKGEDATLVNSILTDQGLEKAAQKLSASEHVKDHWEEGNTHSHATKEEIKIGTAQEASGGGAEKMTKEYSNPAPQHGITLVSEQLGRMLAPINSSMKALAETQVATLGVLKSMVAEKAKKSEDSDEDKDVEEMHESKAKSFLLQAGDLIRKSKRFAAKAEDAKDDGDEEKCKALTAKARTAKREAAVLLGKARLFAAASGNATIKSDVSALIKKSDITVVEDEDEDDDEKESDKAKAAAVTDADVKAAAKTDDAGHQADKKDPANGNQAAQTKAVDTSDSTMKALQDAMSGFKILETTVKGLMEVVAGRSKVSDLVPDISKASPALISSISERLADAEDSGRLSESDAACARNIIAKSGAAKQNLIPATVVSDLLSKAPINVRALFAEATAA